MKNVLARNKKYLILIMIVIAIGFFFGVIYYYFLDNEIKISIENSISNYNNFHYNFIIKDLLLMSLLLVTSFFIIGFPLSIMYILYESFALGFLFNIFVSSFGINGLIFILLFIFTNKLLSLVIKIIFIKKNLNISRYTIGLLFFKKDELINKKIFINYKQALFLIIACLVLNLVLYFISPMFFSSFIKKITI